MVVTDTSDGDPGGSNKSECAGRAGLRGVNLDKAKQINQCILEDRNRPARNQAFT